MKSVNMRKIFLLLCLVCIGICDNYKNKETRESIYEITDKEENERENRKNISCFLKSDFLYEIGSELPKPQDFFFMDNTGKKGITSEEADCLQFASSLVKEQFQIRENYQVDISYGETVIYGYLVVQDTTAPVITAPEKRTIYVGDDINFEQNIEVVDNSGEVLDIMTDSSEVRENIEGKYHVYYSATDSSGNKGRAISEITVKRKQEITRAMAEEEADKLLESLLKPDMTDLEKLWCIFEWCNSNIRYTADSEKGNIVQGAYEGMVYRKGDCYNFYATAAFLMERCGIENISISKEIGMVTHYWSLVKIEQGWYHFDCSKHKGVYKCFMQTDEQVRKFGQEVKNNADYFNVEDMKLPERGTEIIYEN